MPDLHPLVSIRNSIKYHSSLISSSYLSLGQFNNCKLVELCEYVPKLSSSYSQYLLATFFIFGCPPPVLLIIFRAMV